MYMHHLHRHIIFYCILSCSIFCSVLFYYILFYSILFPYFSSILCSNVVLFYLHFIQFYSVSILCFCSCAFCSISNQVLLVIFPFFCAACITLSSLDIELFVFCFVLFFAFFFFNVTTLYNWCGITRNLNQAQLRMFDLLEGCDFSSKEQTFY